MRHPRCYIDVNRSVIGAVAGSQPFDDNPTLLTDDEEWQRHRRRDRQDTGPKSALNTRS
jgi:hypothetical protein